MGNFYVNICVKSDDPTSLLQVFESAGGGGILVDDKSGWLVVATPHIETQNQTEIDMLGHLITENRPVSAISFLNHDDDILSVDVYEKGGRIGSYNSAPGYFLEDPSPEDMRPKLVNPAAYAALGTGVTEEDIVEVFQPNASYIPALQLHMDIVKLLGITTMSVGFGYNYAMRGELRDAQDKMVTFGGVALQ